MCISFDESRSGGEGGRIVGSYMADSNKGYPSEGGLG